MKKQLFSLAILLGSLSFGQSYSSGGLSTGATSSSGSAAPSGYTWSELQGGNTSYGFSGVYSNSANVSFRLADDFTVPANEKWTVSSVEVFAYQTGSTSFPFNGLSLQIWNGSPDTGTLVFGNTTTNVLDVSGSSDSKMYRVSSAVGTTRRIWKLKASVSKELLPGTYWLDYQGHATNDSSAFFPAVTLLGSAGPDNANSSQKDVSTNVWTGIVDTGSGSAQALPFIITYTATTMGVSENRQFDSRLTLYPNPAVESFKLDIPAESKTPNTVISLFDASGKLVKTYKVSDSYNVSDLPKGNYLLKLNDGKNNKVTKLIKK